MECGVKNSVFSVDERTKQYLDECSRSPMHVINSGRKAEVRDEYEIECSKLEPVVAGPDLVDKVKTVDEVGNVEIDEAYIGSATNGRIEDLEAAARVLKAQKVRKGSRCVITPASERVFREAMHRGYVDIFLDAGAVFTNATCGACVGTHLGILGENEVCVSSSSRNYVGRMGAFTAKVYLASPATVAASAVEGKIADPRGYLG
jgi:3-isopropylmalate/(R)-2-methylmalate dehydratase large subunit